MATRKSILAAIAAALPTTGDGVKFKSIHRGLAGTLSASELPAALVRCAGEDVAADKRGPGWAVREMDVEVDVLMKHTTNLDDAMQDYAEAVEAAVLHDASVAALVDTVLPDGFDPIEFDKESEKPVAQATVKFTVTYQHWPEDPAEQPVADPYASE